MQLSRGSLIPRPSRHRANPKTASNWKRRTSFSDHPTRSKDAHSTVLSIEDEAIIVVVREHTPLPLDDSLFALQATIPGLT
jgi:hypothetical protein